jgi:hypothetical protein
LAKSLVPLSVSVLLPDRIQPGPSVMSSSSLSAPRDSATAAEGLLVPRSTSKEASLPPPFFSSSAWDEEAAVALFFLVSPSISFFFFYAPSFKSKN